MDIAYNRSHRALYVDGKQVAVCPVGTKNQDEALAWWKQPVKRQNDFSYVFVAYEGEEK